VQAAKDNNARRPKMVGLNQRGKYFVQNPRRAHQEIRAISHSEIEKELEEIHNNGTGIAVVNGVDESGFLWM